MVYVTGAPRERRLCQDESGLICSPYRESWL